MREYLDHAEVLVGILQCRLPSGTPQERTSRNGDAERYERAGDRCNLPPRHMSATSLSPALGFDMSVIERMAAGNPG